MSLSSAQLDELGQALADRLYVQVAGWHLYLGDAKLARPLAEELAGLLDQGLWRLAKVWSGCKFPLVAVVPSCRSPV